MKVSIRMNKPLTYSFTLPPFYLLTARLHLQNFVMFRYYRNELCCQLWWPTYCNDSHAMNSFSPAYTCVISLACLVCQQAHESPILGMSVRSVWAECLGMLKGLVFISRYLRFTCILMMDVHIMKIEAVRVRRSGKEEEIVTGKTHCCGSVGGRFQIFGHVIETWLI